MSIQPLFCLASWIKEGLLPQATGYNVTGWRLLGVGSPEWVALWTSYLNKSFGLTFTSPTLFPYSCQTKRLHQQTSFLTTWSTSQRSSEASSSNPVSSQTIFVLFLNHLYSLVLFKSVMVGACVMNNLSTC